MILLFSVTARAVTGNNIRLRGQAVKTSPFHGGNTGSIPVGVTEDRKVLKIENGAIAKW